MKIGISFVTKQVTAAAHVRHRVTANLRTPDRVASIQIPARRGPIGPEGKQGKPGSIGGDDPVIFDGGNF